MRALGRLGEARFRLAFCAINSFLHLPDAAAQLAALRAVHRRLEPGGRLILDLFHPHPDVLADYDGRLAHEKSFVDPATGDRIDKFVSRTLDAATQTIHTAFIYDRVGAGGRLTRTVAPFRLRYIHRYELELLLERAGFTLAELLGDYALAPFAADSLHLIAVARPTPKTRPARNAGAAWQRRVDGQHRARPIPGPGRRVKRTTAAYSAGAPLVRETRTQKAA